MSTLSKISFYTFKLQRAEYYKKNFSFAQLFCENASQVEENQQLTREKKKNRRENKVKKALVDTHFSCVKTACF